MPLPVGLLEEMCFEGWKPGRGQHKGKYGGRTQVGCSLLRGWECGGSGRREVVEGLGGKSDES